MMATGIKVHAMINSGNTDKTILSMNSSQNINIIIRVNFHFCFNFETFILWQLGQFRVSVTMPTPTASPWFGPLVGCQWPPHASSWSVYRWNGNTPMALVPSLPTETWQKVVPEVWLWSQSVHQVRDICTLDKDRYRIAGYFRCRKI